MERARRARGSEWRGGDPYLALLREDTGHARNTAVGPVEIGYFLGLPWIADVVQAETSVPVAAGQYAWVISAIDIAVVCTDAEGRRRSRLGRASRGILGFGLDQCHQRGVLFIA